MDDDELGRLMRAIDPVRTSADLPLTERELAVMDDIASGRRTVRALAHGRPRRQLKRIGWLAAGVAVAIGGTVGGIAIADSMLSQGFSATWADADYVHAFALPSGRGCEVRVMVVDDDGGRELSGVSAELSQQFAGNDLWETFDWDDATLRDAWEAEQNPNQTTLLEENGRLADASVSPSLRTPDDVRANVVSIALDAAIAREAATLNIEPGAVSIWKSIRCNAAIG